MAEIGLMQGYSPEELADYLQRFYNASKGKDCPRYRSPRPERFPQAVATAKRFQWFGSSQIANSFALRINTSEKGWVSPVPFFIL